MRIFKKRENRKSRLGLACMAVLMMLFSSACKKEEVPVVAEGSHVPGADYAYVAKIQEIDGEEIGRSGMRNVIFSENAIYYRYFENLAFDDDSVECRSMESLQEEVKARFTFEVDGFLTGADTVTIDEEGIVYVIWNTYPPYIEGEEYEYKALSTWLVKYDKEGNQLESFELSDVMEQYDNPFINQMLVSEDGLIYMTAWDRIFVYNEKLKLKNTIRTENFADMFLMNGSRVFGMSYTPGGKVLTELDGEKGEIKKSYGNVPGFSGFFADGKNGKLLYAGSSKLYEYDLETEESVEVLDWTDVYVDGNYISAFHVLEDGRFVLLCDYTGNNPEVIYLTKTPVSQIPKKEILTLAVFMADDSNLQQAVIAFNRSSDKYKVELKSYYENGNSNIGTDREAAVTLLHMDIVNGEAPDIISLRELDMYNLGDCGALEDLMPYLENSTILNADDFEESILEAYQVDGAQITIPRSVWIKTVMGKSSLVGEKQGWTIEDMVKLKEKYPDATLMRNMDRDAALKMCLQYGWEGFVDEETGNTFFDSPEFIKVLELAKSIGPYGGFVKDAYEALQKNELLLLEEVVTRVSEYQMNLLLIEEPAANIGYPTADGTPTTSLMGWDSYAISTRSDCKEGAWAFIESVLMEDNLRRVHGFPSRTDLLEQVFAKAMVQEYEKDADGNVVLDEEGNPVKISYEWSNGSWTGYIYAATEEEIAGIRQLLQSARADGVRSQAVLDIVLEEAGAYFAGQKSAEEVAEIIQSRVEIYVSENR